MRALRTTRATPAHTQRATLLPIFPLSLNHSPQQGSPSSLSGFERFALSTQLATVAGHAIKLGEPFTLAVLFLAFVLWRARP